MKYAIQVLLFVALLFPAFGQSRIIQTPAELPGTFGPRVTFERVDNVTVISGHHEGITSSYTTSATKISWWWNPPNLTVSSGLFVLRHETFQLYRPFPGWWFLLTVKQGGQVYTTSNVIGFYPFTINDSRSLIITRDQAWGDILLPAAGPGEVDFKYVLPR